MNSQFSENPLSTLNLARTIDTAIRSTAGYHKLSTSIQNDIRKLNPTTLLWQWAVLLISLIGGSFTGVFYFYIQIDCQLLKSSWRQLALIIAMAPIAYWEYRKEKNTFRYSKESLMNIKSWKTMFWATLGHSIWTVSILVSVNYTSVAQAYLFTNLHSIMIVLYNFIMKIPINKFEIVGSILATGGTIFLAFDSDVHSKEGMVNLSQVSFLDRLIFGDMVGLLGSIGAAFYFTKNHELKYDFPLYLGIFVMSIIGFLQISIASVILEGSTFSFDTKNGLFGVFSQDWFVIYIYIVIITGYGAYVAYVLALKYFDALLVSVVITLEPVTGAIIVFLLGWQSFPGPLTILGFCFILPGIMVVTLGRDRRVKKMEENLETLTGVALLQLSMEKEEVNSA